MTAEKELRKIMADLFGLKEEGITDDTSFENTEKWDSLKHIELVLSIEEQFNISLDADDIVAMLSFAEIKRVMREKGVKI